MIDLISRNLSLIFKFFLEFLDFLDRFGFYLWVSLPVNRKVGPNLVTRNWPCPPEVPDVRPPFLRRHHGKRRGRMDEKQIKSTMTSWRPQIQEVRQDCICNGKAEGDWIGCENGSFCPIEWFHSKCMGLSPPFLLDSGFVPHVNIITLEILMNDHARQFHLQNPNAISIGGKPLYLFIIFFGRNSLSRRTHSVTSSGSMSSP